MAGTDLCRFDISWCFGGFALHLHFCHSTFSILFHWHLLKIHPTSTHLSKVLLNHMTLGPHAMKTKIPVDHMLEPRDAWPPSRGKGPDIKLSGAMLRGSSRKAGRIENHKQFMDRCACVGTGFFHTKPPRAALHVIYEQHVIIMQAVSPASSQ